MGTPKDDDVIDAVTVTVTAPGDSADTVITRDRGGSSVTAAPALARGTTVGRYVILDLIGRGGMGVVYKAADPELDRRVALKLLRARAGDDANASARLLREAQALAQLSHPNVVTVYDAGQFGDDVYIAMELVEGATLRAWLRAEPRARAEILDVMVSAGAGVAAAHRAGIIHRDFKPDNVIVDADGRVRVIDFGLARAAHVTSPPPRQRSPSSPPIIDLATTPSGEHKLLATELSVAGSVRGTPAYMAAEQHSGGEVDGRADQFAFCVVLYEVLHGARPFAGRTLDEIAGNVTAGRLARPITDLDAPGWLRAVIVRGLSARPEDRFGSMNALLDELTRERGRLRRQVVAGVALVVLMGGAAIVGRMIGDDGARPSPCASVESELDDAWGPRVATAVRKAFLATGRPYAADTAARVDRVLDAYARDWISARRDSCEATLVRGNQSSELMERRVACLARRSGKLAALTSAFATAPTEDLLEHAIELAHGLPALDACNDRDALLATVPLPDEAAARERIAALGARIDAVEARAQGGAVKEALVDLTAPLAEIRAIGYPPLLAEALLLRATLEVNAGDPAAAEHTLYEAAQVAAEAKDDLLAARVWTRLLNVVGDGQARHADALVLARVTAPALTRAGADPVLRAEYMDQIGNVLWAQGKNREARPYHELAMALRSAVLAPDDPEISASLVHLGGLAWSQGQFEEARALLERGLAIRVRSFGPDHPDVSKLLTNLGSVATSQGDLEAALSYHRRALAIAEASMGADHTLVAICANNLADVERAMGRYPAAREHLERAAAIFTTSLGETHPHAATAIQNLGEVFLAEHEPEQALRHFERALAGFEASVGVDHPFVAYPLTAIGHAQLEAGRAALAVAPLERALAIREAQDAQPTELATTRFALAQALRAIGAPGRRAITLGEAAREVWASAGVGFAKDLERVTAWLAAQPP